MSNNKACYTTPVLIILIIILLQSISFSAELDNTSASDDKTIPSLPTIHVEAPRIAATTGTVILDKQLIEDLPTRNGSENELIGIAPAVQYSENYNLSQSGGEIYPPPVSISGSRFYDNHYTIDGLDNTSILNPGSDMYNDSYTLPGTPQKQFLNPRLIEQITIFNSNIPAEFGGFTGGQINVKTIEPTPEFWGQLSYRTTNDQWTKFHIESEDKEEFFAAESSEYQPKFNKQDFGLILNTPLSNGTSVLTAYQKTISEIEQNSADGAKTNRREKENVLLKANHFFNNSTQITFTGLYSPTHNSYFLKDFHNSNYSIDRNVYSLNLEVEKDFSFGQLSIQTGHAAHQIKRNAPLNRFIWNTSSEELNREGGNGNLEYSEREISFKSKLKIKSFNMRETNHHIDIGVEAGYETTGYLRPKSSSTYASAQVAADTICSPGDPACLEGDRYLKIKTTYNEADTSDSNTQLRFFIQDSMVWKRLELFPGLRVNYDSLTEDVNFAPRLSSSLDFFGDGSTIMFAGRNKYYSSTLLEPGTYSYTFYNRDSSTQNWYVKNYNNFITADIKSPSTTETTIGVIQKIFGGELKGQYIHKESKNEFARTHITTKENTETIDSGTKTVTYNTYYLNNDGQSEYESMLLSWQKTWEQHYFEINSTWQVSTTSNGVYTDNFDREDARETYWYEGKEYYKYEKPKADFNRPTVVNMIYRWQINEAVNFTNTLKYRGQYWTLRYAGTQPSVLNPDQERDPFIYKKVKAKSALTVDWSVNWRVLGIDNYDIIVNLDILNVFNKRNKQGYLFNNYDIGRQFWLGIDFNF